MTGNKGGKNNNSIQLTCVESWIAIHIFAKFPLYRSKVLFVFGHFMLVLGVVLGISQFSVFLGCSRWFSVVLSV